MNSPSQTRPAWPLTALVFPVLAVWLIFGSGCGPGLFGWSPLVKARAPVPTDRVQVAVPGAFMDASDVPHVSAFYDALAAHGTWSQDPGLGWIWSPSDDTYVPYATGRWIDTEAGPTYLCDEPYGWATTHYGRWFHRDRWSWVPDVRWGPAWVSWRVGDGLIGWAPLGPESVQWPLPDAAWRFVAAPDFWQPNVAARTYPSGHIPWLLASSRPLDRSAQVGRSTFVVGPEVRYAGWRARKVPLEGLPQARVRWMPRYERGPIRLDRPSVRAAPATSQRFGRKAPDVLVPRKQGRPAAGPHLRLRPPKHSAPRAR